MSINFKITATIVIHNQDKDILNRTINSFLKISINKKLYIIDNASKRKNLEIISDNNIEYIYLKENIGFGAAHNLVIDKLKSNFHLILNPDVEFLPSIINGLINKLKKEDNVSFITPKIIYPNAHLQYVCRHHPTFFNLFERKLGLSKNHYIEETKGEDFYPEFIHGCFMLFKTKDFINLKGFDERFLSVKK